jgi:Leucine Rich repeat
MVRLEGDRIEEESLAASPSADRSAWGYWVARAALALALGGCAMMMGFDRYQEARTEQALREIQKVGGLYLRKNGSQRGDVIGIDLDDSVVYDSGWVRPRGHVTDEIFPLLQRFGQLQELSLAGADVSDAGLVGLRELSDLRRLNLSRTHLTDSGLVSLKELARLRAIDLRGTQVTPEGVRALRRALPMAEILADEPD